MKSGLLLLELKCGREENFPSSQNMKEGEAKIGMTTRHVVGVLFVVCVCVYDYVYDYVVKESGFHPGFYSWEGRTG